MRAAIPFGLLASLLALPSVARASFDEFAEERVPTHFELRSERLTLAIKGELALALHDLEGEGGPEHDSPTDTRTLGTRSPNVEIDAFWLALRLGLAEQLGVNSVLELTTRGASVGAVWLDWRRKAPEALTHHLELGYQRPIVAIDRRSERYPLVATSYWRDPELHLAYEAAWALSQAARIEAGLSLAMMRPLDFAGVQQSRSQAGTINVLAYGPARTFSGNGPVGGGRLRLVWRGAFAEGFGFRGRLAAQSGTDVLRSGFPSYRDLKGYSAGTLWGDFWWAGGRAGFEGKRLHAVAEAVASREDLLRRWGGYAQASWRFPLSEERDWLRAVEPLVRGEVYRIAGSAEPHQGVALRSPALINAVSWDWDVLTLSLIGEVYRDVLFARLEYYVIREANGVPALGVADQPFPNDELLVQVAFRF